MAGVSSGRGAGSAIGNSDGIGGKVPVPAADARAARGSYLDADAAFKTAVMIFAVSPAVEGALVAAAASNALVMPSASPAEDAASKTLLIVLAPAAPPTGNPGRLLIVLCGCGGALGVVRGGTGARTGGIRGAGGLRLASRDGGKAAAAAVTALAEGGSRLARSGMVKVGAGGGATSLSDGGIGGASVFPSSCLA